MPVRTARQDNNLALPILVEINLNSVGERRRRKSEVGGDVIVAILLRGFIQLLFRYIRSVVGYEKCKNNTYKFPPKKLQTEDDGDHK